MWSCWVEVCPGAVNSETVQLQRGPSSSDGPGPQKLLWEQQNQTSESESVLEPWLNISLVGLVLEAVCSALDLALSGTELLRLDRLLDQNLHQLQAERQSCSTRRSEEKRRLV